MSHVANGRMRAVGSHGLSCGACRGRHLLLTIRSAARGAPVTWRDPFRRCGCGATGDDFVSAVPYLPGDGIRMTIGRAKRFPGSPPRNPRNCRLRQLFRRNGCSIWHGILREKSSKKIKCDEGPKHPGKPFPAVFRRSNRHRAAGDGEKPRCPSGNRENARSAIGLAWVMLTIGQNFRRCSICVTWGFFLSLQVARQK